jgi:hypothetical protein
MHFALGCRSNSPTQLHRLPRPEAGHGPATGPLKTSFGHSPQSACLRRRRLQLLSRLRFTLLSSSSDAGSRA